MGRRAGRGRRSLKAGKACALPSSLQMQAQSMHAKMCVCVQNVMCKGGYRSVLFQCSVPSFLSFSVCLLALYQRRSPWAGSHNAMPAPSPSTHLPVQFNHLPNTQRSLPRHTEHQQAAGFCVPFSARYWGLPGRAQVRKSECQKSACPVHAHCPWFWRHQRENATCLALFSFEGRQCMQ